MKNRQKKNESVFRFPLFGQPKNRLTRSVFDREKPTKKTTEHNDVRFLVHNPATAPVVLIAISDVRMNLLIMLMLWYYLE